MSFGPVTIATLETMDVQAPGAPGLSARQTSNREGEFTLTPPSTDADGSPLSGLTFGQVAVIQADAETAEAYRSEFAAALQFNGAQVFELDVTAGDQPMRRHKSRLVRSSARSKNPGPPAYGSKTVGERATAWFSINIHEAETVGKHPDPACFHHLPQEYFPDADIDLLSRQ